MVLRRAGGSVTYFDYYQQIEENWKALRTAGFPQSKRDEFRELCQQGRQAFKDEIVTERINSPLGLRVKHCPAYERAIMLLEHEGRYLDAIKLCFDAKEIGITDDWYDKRLAKLEKRIGREEKG
jgi:hypothetical protein